LSIAIVLGITNPTFEGDNENGVATLNPRRPPPIHPAVRHILAIISDLKGAFPDVSARRINSGHSISRLGPFNFLADALAGRAALACSSSDVRFTPRVFAPGVSSWGAPPRPPQLCFAPQDNRPPCANASEVEMLSCEVFVPRQNFGALLPLEIAIRPICLAGWKPAASPSVALPNRIASYFVHVDIPAARALRDALPVSGRHLAAPLGKIAAAADPVLWTIPLQYHRTPKSRRRSAAGSVPLLVDKRARWALAGRLYLEADLCGAHPSATLGIVSGHIPDHSILHKWGSIDGRALIVSAVVTHYSFFKVVLAPAAAKDIFSIVLNSGGLSAWRTKWDIPSGVPPSCEENDTVAALKAAVKMGSSLAPALWEAFVTESVFNVANGPNASARRHFFLLLVTALEDNGLAILESCLIKAQLKIGCLANDALWVDRGSVRALIPELSGPTAAWGFDPDPLEIAIIDRAVATFPDMCRAELGGIFFAAKVKSLGPPLMRPPRVSRHPRTRRSPFHPARLSARAARPRRLSAPTSRPRCLSPRCTTRRRSRFPQVRIPLC
jgi:hypothetical protein